MARIGIAAPNAASADAGLSVATDGGGAVDAAIAAMFTAMVNEPGIVSLTGGAFITIWPAGSASPVTVDGCVAQPGLGRAADAAPPDVREVHTDYGGGVTMTVGHGSVATPGALAALNLAHDRYGNVPWRDVVAPAQAIAGRGFTLGNAASYYLKHTRDSVFAWDPQTSAALKRKDGSWVAPGDTMVIDGLADTLALIAEDGMRAMYDGDLATAITADIASRGGLLSRHDLNAYRPVVRETLGSSSGDWQLRTNPPPAFGGAVLTAMLTLLGDRPRGEWTVDDVAHLVAVLRRVLGYRRECLDPASNRERAARAMLDEVALPQRGSASTVHISVVDSSGAACAITASSGYGSGATVPGTGLWLNNCLGEHELTKGPAPAPGERLASNMAPTVGRSNDGGVLAIGTPGADRITTALTQVLASFTNGHTDLQQAIDRPRLHLHYLDDATDSARIEAEEDMPLPELDLPVRRHHPLSMYFGGVGAAYLAPSGEITAAADPRRAGAVAISPD
ncbi:MAG: gamma-glutamyltransferase [Sporichthyaceae bacterium]